MSALAVPLALALAIAPGRFAVPTVHEVHRIRIVNRDGGPIVLSRDRGRTWTHIGRVLKADDGVVHAIQDKEFTASDWAPVSSVAATAVNAIHLKFDQREHATVLTLQPKEFYDESRARQAASYMARDASIYTDVPAGTSIFAADAPLIGDPIELSTTAGVIPAPRTYVPRIGDVLQIRVLEPVRLPQRIELENRFGGTVIAYDRDGSFRRVAQVMRPVMGVGRFTGTQFADVGDVRANHPGVLCISTSPVGEIGGFQIVPSTHASHPDLDYVRGKPVWLVVGPLGAVQPDLEGTFPLFRGHFRPRRSKVKVRLDGGPWVDLPKAVGLKEGALKKVTHLAIYP